MNRVAAAQREGGGNEAILAIAEENGVDKEDAMDFIGGYVAVFVTPLMAAYEKLNIETKELKSYEIIGNWLQYTKLRCMEEPEMVVTVRRRGENLKGCIVALPEWSMKDQHPADSDTLKAVKINYGVTSRIPGMGCVKEITMEYYMRKEQ